MYRQIGILTGGGDAPGLNAAIRAVVRTAIGEFGMNCIGIEDSFEGILGDTHTRKLTKSSVSGILPRGGTMLGTRNRGSFAADTSSCQFSGMSFAKDTLKAVLDTDAGHPEFADRGSNNGPYSGI